MLLDAENVFFIFCILKTKNEKSMWEAYEKGKDINLRILTAL